MRTKKMTKMMNKTRVFVLHWRFLSVVSSIMASKRQRKPVCNSREKQATVAAALPLWSPRTDLVIHVIFQSLVAHDNHNSTEASENFREQSLVHTLETFLLEDLDTAVNTGFVGSLSSRFLGLKHESSSNGVEWVVEWKDDCSGGGGDDDSRHESLDSGVALVRVQSHDGSVQTKLSCPVHESSCNRNCSTTVQTPESLLLDGLGKAVEKSVELSFSGSEVTGKTSTGEVKRVADNHGSGTTKTTSHQVVEHVFHEFFIFVCFGEH